MKMLKNSSPLAIYLAVCCSGMLLAQELSVLRQEVSTTSDSSAVVKSQPPKKFNWIDRGQATLASAETECDDDGDSLNQFIGGVFMAGVSSPFWGPRAVIGDDSHDPGYFLRYPYLHDRTGALSERRYSVEGSRTWMLRARSDYTSDFAALSRVGGAVLWETASRWGLDSEFNYRQEDLIDSNDQLWTGDANLIYRFAQSEQLQMRTGVGLNWLADHATSSDFGFNFTYGGDWFPVRPLIISHEIDWGTLGNATLFHGRVTVGVNYHRLELFTGYDYFDVGQAEISGMVGGVRLWLSK